jgi:hypothetical protein
MREIFANRRESDVIEIFAVLSKKQYAMVQNEEAELEIPFNTELENKAGSRRMYFTCYGKVAATELVDGLDASSIEWQEVYRGEDVISELSRPVKDEET